MSNDVTFDLTLAVKDFNQNLKKVDNNLNNFHKDFNKQVKSSSAAWSSFSGNLGALGVQAAISGLTSLANNMASFVKESTMAAINAQETASKFDAVFSTISEASAKTANDLQKNYGLGVTESKALLSATGDLLTGFGFAQEGALSLSSQVQKVAVDLASFTNFSGGAQGASEAITKALLGETESMKALGVSINQKAVADQVLINNSKGITFETDRQAKAQATLDIILQQSVNSIGDYGKTSGGAANQLKLLNTRIEDMKIAIGDKLIPVVMPMIQQMIKWLEVNEDFITSKVAQSVDKLTEAFKFLKTNMDSIVIVAGTALAALISLSTVSLATSAISGVTTAVVILKGALIALSGPIGITIAAVAALGGAVAWAMSQGQDREAVKAVEDLGRATANLADLKERLKQAEQGGASEGILESIQARIDKETLHLESLQAAADVKAELTNKELLEIQSVSDAKDVAANKDSIMQATKTKQEDLLAKKRADKKRIEQDIINKENVKQSEFEVALFGRKQNAMTAWQESSGAERAANLKSTLGTMATLQSSGYNTLAAIGKASAVSMATIDGIAAVQKALASAPPPFNFALAATVGTATALNVAQIAGVKFERGGIVGGSSFTGDSIHAQVNSGEMILNRGQQAQLFQDLNNGTGSANNNQDLSEIVEAIRNIQIVLQADDTEIARSTSRGVQNGIEIGRSR